MTSSTSTTTARRCSMPTLLPNRDGARATAEVGMTMTVSWSDGDRPANEYHHVISAMH